MTAKDVFILVVWLFGVACWTWMLFNLGHVVVELLHLPDPGTPYSPVALALSALELCVVSGLLFAGAAPLGRLAYGRGPGSN